MKECAFFVSSVHRDKTGTTIAANVPLDEDTEGKHMYPMIYRKRARRTYCAALLFMALLLRLAGSPQQTAVLADKLHTAAERLPAKDAVLFLTAGIRLAEDGQTKPTEVPPQTASPTEDTEPETTQPPQPSEALPQPVQLSFDAEEAEMISFRGNCTYTVDKQALLEAPLSWKTPVEGPQVLIIHSHTSESYTPSEGYTYEASGDYRTLDNSRSVVAVGDVLAKTLEAEGIGVIHDTTCHDYPSYNSSYANARQTVERELAAHPTIVMVIDVHRDAAEEVFRETAEVEGETAAKLMLVVGTDEGGLSHPFWRENLSCALKLQALANRRYPGLFKSIALRASRFNQDETPASLIVEVGSTGNTLPEALAAAKYLGSTVAELLRSNR